MNYIDLTQNTTGGVSDYDLLSNQPQINGVTLTGNKSATDLNIYLPDGYTINVATDGSGDFTDLQSALDSLNGKVCAGTVTVKLKASNTFNITSTIEFPTSANIHQIKMLTEGTPATIQSTTTRITLQVSLYCGANIVDLENINIIGSSVNVSNSTCVANYGLNTILYMYNCNVSNSVWGITSEQHTSSKIQAVTCTNCTNGIASNLSNIGVNGGTFINCTNALQVVFGGIIQTMGTPTLTSVTNKFGRTANTVTGNGLIISSW